MLRRLERARKGAAKYAAATEQCSRLVTTAATLCAQLRLALEHEDLGVLALFPGLRERLAAQQMRQLDKLCRVLARRAQEMRTESEEIEALAREAFQAHAAELADAKSACAIGDHGFSIADAAGWLDELARAHLMDLTARTEVLESISHKLDREAAEQLPARWEAAAVVSSARLAQIWLAAFGVD